MVIQDGALEIRFPEYPQALLEVHDTYAAIDSLADTLCDLTAYEVIHGKGQSTQEDLSAVLEAGSPLKERVQRVSHLSHRSVEMSAEIPICSSGCGPCEPLLQGPYLYSNRFVATLP